MELVNLRQSMPKSPGTSRSQERRDGLLLEMPPEVDLSFRPPCWSSWRLGCEGKMSRKWTDAVRAEGVDSTDR